MSRPSRRQSGGALAYVFAAMFLMAALSAAHLRSVHGNARGQYLATTTDTVHKAAQLILDKVRLCALGFPAGNNGTGFNAAYPGGTTETAVSGLDCPGYPGANKNLWAGYDAVFLPPTPSGFTGWNYQNDGAGIYIKLAGNGDADLTHVLSNVAGKYSASEAVLVGDDLTIWVKK